jgi:hypothetical protein
MFCAQQGTHLLPAAGAVLDGIAGLELNLLPDRDTLVLAAVRVATAGGPEAASMALFFGAAVLCVRVEQFVGRLVVVCRALSPLGLGAKT